MMRTVFFLCLLYMGQAAAVLSEEAGVARDSANSSASMPPSPTPSPSATPLPGSDSGSGDSNNGLKKGGSALLGMVCFIVLFIALAAFVSYLSEDDVAARAGQTGGGGADEESALAGDAAAGAGAPPQGVLEKIKKKRVWGAWHRFLFRLVNTLGGELAIAACCMISFILSFGLAFAGLNESDGRFLAASWFFYLLFGGMVSEREFLREAKLFSELPQALAFFFGNAGLMIVIFTILSPALFGVGGEDGAAIVLSMLLGLFMGCQAMHGLWKVR